MTRQLPRAVKLSDTWPLWTLSILSIGAGAVAIATFWQRIADTRPQLGPGAYPTIVGAALLVLGVALLVQTFRNPQPAIDAAAHARTRDQWRALALLAAYLVVMPRIGFAEATALFLAAYQIWVARYPRLRSIVVALLFAIGLSQLFVRLLPMGLPTGILDL